MLHVLANLISVKWSCHTPARASARARDSPAPARSRLALKAAAHRRRNYKMRESEPLLVRRDIQIQQLATGDTQDWGPAATIATPRGRTSLHHPGLFTVFLESTLDNLPCHRSSSRHKEAAD